MIALFTLLSYPFRYHYGDRDYRSGGPSSLIMPGHVQTLGILRGASGRQGQGSDEAGKIVPTGNPALDAERQVCSK